MGSIPPGFQQVLLAAEPLNEVRIERNGTILWRRLASSTQVIEGPIGWPLDALKPNESLQLKLRPRGGSGGECAVADHRCIGPRDGTRMRLVRAGEDNPLERQSHQAAPVEPVANNYAAGA